MMDVLVISHDVVGKRMAGPGIRYYHLARVLGREFETVLAVPSEIPPDISSEGFRFISYTRRDWDSIATWVAAADTVIFPSDIASDFPLLAQSDAFLVVDGYDPLLAEWLTLSQGEPLENWERYWWNRMCSLNEQYLMGDFFICASERQRDWWLGLLEANGRINPHTFKEDPSLRSLIDVVPYGLPDVVPQSREPVIKGVWSGIEPEDKVILWGGGLWPWLDPLTAIRAVAEVWRQRQDVRLIFPGTKHPNPWMEKIPTHTEAARTLAQELGLLNKAVFFGDWIPYEDWSEVLLESDLALALHYDTLETRLAFRSRVLEYIWAGLPTVATQGDATSDLIDDHELGIVVDYEDTQGVTEAILRLLDTPRQSFAQRFAKARGTLTWEQAAKPLLRFCRKPRRAPDKIRSGEVGNPFYLKPQQQLRIERDYWRDLVKQYEQGRFIRLMHWLHQIGQRIRGNEG